MSILLETVDIILEVSYRRQPHEVQYTRMIIAGPTRINLSPFVVPRSTAAALAHATVSCRNFYFFSHPFTAPRYAQS